MKQLLIILFFSMAGSLCAQHKDSDKIKALKTAYITQELGLNNQTAKKFWPVYDNYEEKHHKLRQREHPDFGNIESLKEAAAQQMIQEFVNIEYQEYVIKKEYFNNLKKILSSREIIKLQKIEDDFHRKLIKEYWAKKTKEKK